MVFKSFILFRSKAGEGIKYTKCIGGLAHPVFARPLNLPSLSLSEREGRQAQRSRGE
jgi:hypothetical protein